MAKAKELTAFDEAKLAVDEAVKTLQAATHALVGELNALEGRKATLSVEIDQISHGIEPLRKERDGQQAEVAKAYEEARAAKKDTELKISQLKGQIQHWEQEVERSKKKALDAYQEEMAKHTAAIKILEETHARKKEEFENFMAKFVKGA